MLGLIWYKIAELERSVYAIRRITREIIIIAAVPESTTAPLLKASKSVIPKTEPGIMYGNIAAVSMRFVSKLLRLTERYATSIPIKMIAKIAIRPYT